MRLILLLAALFLTPAAGAAQEQAPRPVTVLVGIDGFRADYLERGVTPHLLL